MTGTRTAFYVPGKVSKLSSKSTQRVPVVVEGKNLSTGEVLSFDTITEAAQHLGQILERSDLRGLISSLSNHIRKVIPTPYHGYLWRTASKKSKPWPKYDHIDPKTIRSSRILVSYPIYIKDLKAGCVHECHDKDQVLDVVEKFDIYTLSQYLARRLTYKQQFLFSSTREGLVEKEKIKQYRGYFRYTYTVFDSLKDKIQTYATVELCSVAIGMNSSSVKQRFHMTKPSNTFYFGETARYKVTRIRVI